MCGYARVLYRLCALFYLAINVSPCVSSGFTCSKNYTSPRLKLLYRLQKSRFKRTRNIYDIDQIVSTQFGTQVLHDTRKNIRLDLFHFESVRPLNRPAPAAVCMLRSAFFF